MCSTLFPDIFKGFLPLSLDFNSLSRYDFLCICPVHWISWICTFLTFHCIWKVFSYYFHKYFPLISSILPSGNFFYIYMLNYLICIQLHFFLLPFPPAVKSIQLLFWLLIVSTCNLHLILFSHFCISVEIFLLLISYTYLLPRSRICL